LLRYNPHHLLKPYANLAEAFAAVDVQAYVEALRRSHPLEQARQLLATLDPPIHLKAADRREVIPHEPHERKEQVSIYRLRDPEGEKSDSKRHVLASPLTCRDNNGLSSALSVAVKASQAPAVVPPAPDIYRIRREDLPENMDRGDAGERKFAGGQWLVLGLFLAVAVFGLIAAGTVLVRPLWESFGH
jgi:hypothetical protein